jgi:hypothetical protein
MPPKLTPRSLTRLALLAWFGVLLTACTIAPTPSPVTFREIQREDDVYRVIVRWQGAAPADLEDRLLVRCAEVAQREGGTTFFLVNADFAVTNTAFLKEGSPVTPVFRIPEELPADEMPAEGVQAQAEPGASARVTLKVFRPGKAPVGYRLYDVAKILRLRRSVTVRQDGSVGAGIGVQR